MQDLAASYFWVENEGLQDATLHSDQHRAADEQQGDAAEGADEENVEKGLDHFFRGMTPQHHTRGIDKACLLCRVE